MKTEKDIPSGMGESMTHEQRQWLDKHIPGTRRWLDNLLVFGSKFKLTAEEVADVFFEWQDEREVKG
jgi:hypothetical protein